MPSLRTTVLAVAASCVAVVNADYYIEPDSVPISQRRVWCQNTKEACPLICEQTSKGEPKVNSCDPETLTYGCICSDNKQPNVSEYSLTIPYYVCQEWGNQCVEDCKGSNACASSCREDHPCGASDPKRYNTTATATGTGTAAVKATASTTDDADTIFTGNPGGDDDDSSSDSSTSKNGSPALEAGRTWGLAVVLSTMFVGFAML
ncbi:hypothetical protein LCI18_009713 [Fusarium solani-melongenae]|uniref:Uncharacterized protein n=1 Tax=Fusarium solani subsp. cucurbitae TaxID=2747967 RepID=A0ACD3ZFB7_FUSSC|nr:hypothetical protein LCI18_009713 [Fusarium solani-melongenae]